LHSLPDRVSLPRSIVVEHRAEAAALGQQRIAAVAEQVQVKRLAGLPFAVAFDFDRDRIRRLAGAGNGRAGEDLHDGKTSPAIFMIGEPLAARVISASSTTLQSTIRR
jgi:hypothetical protein